MFRTLTLGASALAILAAPVAGAGKPHDKDDYKDYRDDSKEDRKAERREWKDDRKDDRRDRQDERRDARDDRRYTQQDSQADWRTFRNYDYNRPQRGYNSYYADQYYRDGQYYQPRRLAATDRIYRGRDNRYYCRRSDGTTGLIIGGLGGGVLGNLIAPGGSKGLGTILGGVGGALLGRSIDRNNITCR